MDSRLELEQRLSQRLSMLHLRFVRLLELNSPEIDEAIEQELATNPALTIEDNVPGLQASASSDSHAQSAPAYYNFTGQRRNDDSDNHIFSPRDNSESLADMLNRQIDERHLRPEVASMAKYIVGNLDTNGWLTRSLPHILNDLAINHDMEVDNATAEEALKIVRSLDPPGIGGENLAQTLLLQLQRMPESQERDDAIAVLSDYFKEYHMHHSHKILSGLGISKQRFDKAHALILSLNPKPGAPYGGTDATTAAAIIPDFVISDIDGRLSIQLTNRIPELTIEESFSEAIRNLRTHKEQRKNESEFITSRFNDARDFIRLIRRRQQTLMTVMSAIVHLQKDFFDTGDVYTLRPMTLKDLADITGYDLSVISRATSNKYAAMPWGEIIPLKNFFSGSVNSESNKTDDAPRDLTNQQIVALIASLVKEEDPKHPLSDEKLHTLIAEKGYDISRRTIAKYRDRANIPVARLRKKL